MSDTTTPKISEELGRIKSDFAAQTVSTESSMLIKSLIMLLELVFPIFLEKTTKTTSRNSGKPPPQIRKDNISADQKGSKGKGKQESSFSTDNSRTVVTVLVLPVESCSYCGESLKSVKSEGYER